MSSGEILDQLPGQRAQLLLRRYPERPAAALRGTGRAPSPASRTCSRCRQPARPHRRGERRAGRPGPGHAGHALGAARRSRPDLRRHAARRAPASSPASGGRPTTTDRRWSRSTPAWREGWGVGVGDAIRVNVLGRDIDLRIASLRDIAWQSLSLNFAMVASPGLLAHAPHTHIATVRVADAGPGRPAARGHRRAAQRHRHPRGGRAGRGRRPAGPGRRGAGRHRVADAGRGRAGAGRRRRRGSAPAHAGGGDPEDPRRHARRRSARPGWSSSACSAWRPA